ncbi:hypothetical protein [Streptomyces sp. NPDC007346]|uniref:hypothetical protein n=1 Tax=Streptomyces sp. NPDC007346 TaxID=3154682 RepID=UPI003453B96F
MAEIRAAAIATTDECVMLTGWVGRPSIKYNGRGMFVSRAVWMIANGDPCDLWVLHSCHRGDVGCVNVRHLYLGDQTRNMHDMDAAGRRVPPRGLRAARAVLDDAQVRDIRRRFVRGNRWNPGNRLALAEEFGVVPSLISDIANGKRKAWVAG